MFLSTSHHSTAKWGFLPAPFAFGHSLAAIAALIRVVDALPNSMRASREQLIGQMQHLADAVVPEPIVHKAALLLAENKTAFT
jgi:hypothetical protein